MTAWTPRVRGPTTRPYGGSRGAEDQQQRNPGHEHSDDDKYDEKILLFGKLTA
jgi:hypothetical protein